VLKDSLELLSTGGLGLLVLAAFAAAYLGRGVFALRESFGRNRKEFLDQWGSDKDQQRDDLWLEVCVRHCFGAYLPSSLIRRVLTSASPSHLLLSLSSNWHLFDFRGGQLEWLRKWRNSDRWLMAEISLSFVGYSASALLALAWPMQLFTGDALGLSPRLWLLTFGAATVAVWFLFRGLGLQPSGGPAQVTASSRK